MAPGYFLGATITTIMRYLLNAKRIMIHWFAPFKNDQGAFTYAAKERIGLVLLGLFWCLGLAHRQLANPDEGRYAAIALQMLTSGDWVTPRLNGLLYFEKPPFQYWFTALGFKLFGFHSWVSRLLPCLSGLGTALLVRQMATDYRSARSGFVLFGLLLSGPLFYIFGHVLTLDMALTFFLTLWLACAIRLVKQDDNPSEGQMSVAVLTTLAWVAISLAVLTKGLIGFVLPAAVMGLFVVQTGRWRLLGRLLAPRYLMVFILITAPWFIGVQLKNPDFFHFFFIHEHLDRYLSTSHHRTGPWWYFIPLILINGFVCLGLLFTTIYRDFRFNAQHPIRSLLWTYVIVLFVFFSLSESKLPGYVIPIIPALMTLCAPWIDRKQAPSVWTSTSLWFGLLLMACAFYTGSHHALIVGGVTLGLLTGALISASVFLIVSALIERWTSRGGLPQTVLPAALVMSAWLSLFMTYDRATNKAPGEQMSQLIKHNLSVPIYSVGTYNHALGAYLGNPPQTLVSYRDELDFGLSHEPARYIPTLDQWLTVWARDTHAWALVDQSLWSNIPPSALEKVTVRRYGDTYLLQK